MFHHIFAIGVRYVVLVESQRRGVRGFVLHSEQCCVPARSGQNVGECAHPGAVLPAVVSKADQPIALWVSPGEKGAA
ncbi:Uncharacterised protein [Mycobacteroides abscessus subsp. abscessus]|nr:Uncharacterised protein [Mycobacteroides abscessus subsp. abscessus]